MKYTSTDSASLTWRKRHQTLIVEPCGPAGLRVRATMNRAFAEGMRAVGQDEIITLCRSAWAGSQRFDGGQWIKVNAPLEKVPVFVRGDAVVPVRG
jgi:alpha-glucosidase (family GH31 glycosyl hydrolase)